MTDNSKQGTAQYWNEFYGSEAARRLLIPSQFGAFVAGEQAGRTLVFDLGCGTGRDALFLASVGHQVFGFDASSQAIERCAAEAARAGVGASFECLPVGSEELARRMSAILAANPEAPVLVYTRFFLHAISEEVENALLDLVTGLDATRSVRMAAEFRTHRDASLPKATSSHFRRFIDPTQFLHKVSQRGFGVAYFVQGFGFAKYRDDDAHVARVILSR
jgi:methylase of polypeptide subunit release factors